MSGDINSAPVPVDDEVIRKMVSAYMAPERETMEDDMRAVLAAVREHDAIEKDRATRSAQPPDAMAAHLNAINASPPEFDAFVNGKTPKWWQQEKFAIALAAFEFGRSAPVAQPSPGTAIAVAQPAGPDRAWLVEWKAHDYGPQWWGFNHTPSVHADWCADANRAVRFSRREDAERMRLHILAAEGLSGNSARQQSLSVTEHEWPDVGEHAALTPAAVAQPSRVRGYLGSTVDGGIDDH